MADHWNTLRDQARRRRLRELRWTETTDTENRRAWIDPAGRRWQEPAAFDWLALVDDPVNLRF